MLYDIFMDFYIYFIVVFRQVKCFINNFDIFYNLDDIYMKYIFGIQNWDVYKDLYMFIDVVIQWLCVEILI